MKAANFQKGMDVYGVDGTKIGRVVETWPWVDGYGLLAKSRREIADYGPVKGTTELLGNCGSGYLQVVKNRWLETREERYVPFSDVRTVADGCAILASAADDWAGLYGTTLEAAFEADQRRLAA